MSDPHGNVPGPLCMVAAVLLAVLPGVLPYGARAAAAGDAANAPGAAASPRVAGVPDGAQARALADRNGFDLARPDIQAFIDAMVRGDGWSRRTLRALLRQGRARPELLEAMAHPPETTLPWWQYRQRFVTPERLVMGAQFWLAHKELLDEVAVAQGVAPEYLVAILGVETRYGLSTGSYRELDTLMTLAFDYPERGRYFRAELREYLQLAREQHLDALGTEGSYGGALGALQFMPSSYRRYAKRAGGHGPVNLWTDWPAILTSEASFLREHGWRPGEAVLLDATLASGRSVIVSGHARLNDTLGSLRAQGLDLDSRLPDGTAAVLIAAPEESGPDYKVGLNNFHVLTRYNPSINYALAIGDLARRLRAIMLPTVAAAAAGSQAGTR